MASAVILEVPLLSVASLRLADLAGSAFSEADYMSRLMAGMNTGTTTAYLQGVGSGYYQWRPLAGTDDETLITGVSFTGVDDHLYFVHPRGTMRALTAIASAEVTTAVPSGINSVNTLTDSSVDFVSTLQVAVGDIVILSGTGASAKVLTVDDANTLTTTPLDYNAEYTAGQTYYIGRPPGTDTTANYSVTAREWYGRQAYLGILQALKGQMARSPSQNVGGFSSDPDSNYNRITQEIDHLVGIESA